MIAALFGSAACVMSLVHGVGQERIDDSSGDPRSELGGERRSTQGQLSFYLPYDEHLDFEVIVDVALFETAVADCVMSSRVEPYRPPLLLGSPRATPEEVAGAETEILRLHATGEHLLYSMDSLMESRTLPQAWPSAVYREIQKGTEKRRRELLLGKREGVSVASYRGDTTRGAPPGTRIWGEPHSIEVDPDALDMMRAIYLIRTMVREGKELQRCFMVDKLEQWQVVFRRGRTEVLDTAAGRFQALEVLMETEREGQEGDDELRGPFGLSGTVHLWVEASTGVPLLITGDLPAGIFTLGVKVALQSYRGTPEGFHPLPAGD